jgi:hypothetical protein
MRGFTDIFNLNEGLFDQLGLARMPMFSKALKDKYVISVLPDIKKMMDGDPEEESTWIEPYKNIFRKACLQFGGANKVNINKTCNKPQALQKLAEHLLDPNKGLMDQKALDKWASDKTKNKKPSETIWEYTPEDFDKYLSRDGVITKTLLKTGITPGDLKKTGTYVLERMMPTLLKFYTPEVLGRTKFLNDGTLIDPAKAKQLLGKGVGTSINL